MRFLKDIIHRKTEPEDLLPDRDFGHLADTAAEDLMENAADWGDAPEDDAQVLSAVAANVRTHEEEGLEPDDDGFLFAEAPDPGAAKEPDFAPPPSPEVAATTAPDMPAQPEGEDDFLDVNNIMNDPGVAPRPSGGKTDQELAQEALSRLKSPAPAPAPTPQAPGQTEPAAAPVPQAAGGARVKTRLLGFAGESDEGNIFAGARANRASAQATFPVGWLVVVDGPGRGASFALETGVSQIGRGAEQAICLDYGDTAISRENHAAIAFDDEQNTFFIGHGGKSNLVRLNDRPVLATEELSNGDIVRIGETSLRFIAFCSADFSWRDAGADEGRHVRSA